MPTETIRWRQGELFIIDQTLLPGEHSVIRLDTVQSVWDAIKALKVRGAPAIGITAAFGVLVGLNERKPASHADIVREVGEISDYLASSRPTAVNLTWALGRMREIAARGSDADSLLVRLEQEALNIFEEDKRLCREIGENGHHLIKEGDGVLTHCNAGGLATADYGTALAVMFRAHEAGTRFRVFADETRPLLQGARLTVWELMQENIDVTLICDNMAAVVMKENKIQIVMVGADRIVRNGDTANKIGTYGVASLAKFHNIPFYVAAPVSTFDAALATGAEIPIEQRDPKEVTNGFGLRTAPEGVDVLNPAFDVTPADLISGFITERGLMGPPFTDKIAALRSSQPQEIY